MIFPMPTHGFKVVEMGHFNVFDHFQVSTKALCMEHSYPSCTVQLTRKGLSWFSGLWDAAQSFQQIVLEKTPYPNVED
jgi:hypothetical protein